MKTKMKFAVCALVCMTMACAAASAEGSQPGGMGGNRPQMQQGQMKDNRKNKQGQAPDMNNQNGQNQAPDMSNQNGQNQAPGMNDQNGQNQAPDMNNQNQAPDQNGQQPNGGAQNNQQKPNGNQQKPDDQNAPKDMPGRIDAKKLLEDGVIDEDTYNAIEDYFKENAPEKPEDSQQEDGQQPPEKPEGEQDDTQQPPEKPEGEQDDDAAEKPELPAIGGGLDEVQLKSLLDAGVITQEQYDTLLELLTGSGDAA